MDLDLTQADFARKIGVWTRTVAHWERDRSRPLSRQWPGIQKVLGEDFVPDEGEDFRSRLRTARLRVGLTQSELADRVGVHVRSIGNWERGVCRPSRFMLSWLQAVIGL